MFSRVPLSWRECRVALLIVAMVGFALPAAAQTGGAIEGTVADAQDAVLPGVTLTLRNTETGVARSTVSEANGQYRFNGLQPGAYELRAELQRGLTRDATDFDPRRLLGERK